MTTRFFVTEKPNDSLPLPSASRTRPTDRKLSIHRYNTIHVILRARAPKCGTTRVCNTRSPVLSTPGRYITTETRMGYEQIKQTFSGTEQKRSTGESLNMAEHSNRLANSATKKNK